MSPSHNPGPVGGRFRSPVGALVRAGLADSARAASLLDELGALGICPTLAQLADVADPDLALLSLARLAGTPDGAEELRALEQDHRAFARLLSVVGGSAALGDHLVRHPADVRVLTAPDLLVVNDAAPPDPTEGTVSEVAASGIDHQTEDSSGVSDAAVTERQAKFRAELLRAVGADPEAAAPVAASGEPEPLRRAYRRMLLPIAAQDLAAEDPTELFPLVAEALADLATAVLEAALAVARAATPDHHLARLAVIAMGKTGGRELNYVSDVDVIYVAEPATPDVPEARALEVAANLAMALQRATWAAAKEPPIWQVDPNLRPEGKNGPLVRTLESHLAYYRKWAQTWEFQALLKARPAAGDMELGRAYYEATREFVWQAAGREDFVEDAQAMRRRVEQHVAPSEAERQIKLGTGGLRDVEFTVQLLQLVHGRGDASIRSATTLTALEALKAAGYVGRTAADQLEQCYRLARVLEHRVQLHRLKRTHLMPTAPADLRRLARAARIQPSSPEQLEKVWRATRREVRSLHEDLYYRPLLPATAKLSPGEASLAPEAARLRLAALGYRDPDGAMRHIAALTSGVTRRSAIQRQLLPVMLGWFADGADPDAGLLAFRRLSDSLGNSPWFMRMLRDSSGAAERLAHVLAASAYVAENLARSPESAHWLGPGNELEPKSAPELRAEMAAVTSRRTDPTEAVRAIRGLRRRELTRLATGMALGLLDDGAARFAVSSVAGVAIQAALDLAIAEVAGESPLVKVAVIAMGSLGGRESAINSDADVLFVHQVMAGADPAAAATQAAGIAQRVRSLLGEIGPEPALEVDLDLRPEGRSGELSRSVEAYREYYDRWAHTWERQALLRARPLGGDPGVEQAFMELVNAVRYPSAGLTDAQLTDLRLMKARIEAERLPRGVEPSRHLKLGPGGLLDSQWVAQLYQLRYAGAHPELRVTGTVEALQAAAGAGLMAEEDAEALVASWMQAMSIRNANVLWAGKTGPTADVLPSDRRNLRGIGALMGYEQGASGQLVEDRLRQARRARQVFDRLFYA